MPPAPSRRKDREVDRQRQEHPKHHTEFDVMTRRSGHSGKPPRAARSSQDEVVVENETGKVQVGRDAVVDRRFQITCESHEGGAEHDSLVLEIYDHWLRPA